MQRHSVDQARQRLKPSGYKVECPAGLKIEDFRSPGGAFMS